MSVKTYSLKKNRTLSLSKNFVVKEFSCKDGSDTVLIDSDLVAILQKIRNRFGKAVTINSGYRTSAYNKKIGGASQSKHTEGRAADIVIFGVAPLDICQYAESIGVKGIGRYNYFVHVDTRAAKYYWDSRTGAEKPVASFDPSSAEPSVSAKPSAGTDTAPAFEMKIGDIVYYAGQTQYVSANAAKSTSCKPGLARINKISEKAKHPCHLIKTASGGSTVYGWVNTSLMYLKKGCSGQSVGWLQQRLTQKGYDPGGLDNIFGSKTDTALRAFQKAKKLTADGIMGPNTQKALS